MYTGSVVLNDMRPASKYLLALTLPGHMSLLICVLIIVTRKGHEKNVVLTVKVLNFCNQNQLIGGSREGETLRDLIVRTCFAPPRLPSLCVSLFPLSRCTSINTSYRKYVTPTHTHQNLYSVCLKSFCIETESPLLRLGTILYKYEFTFQKVFHSCLSLQLIILKKIQNYELLRSYKHL